MQDRLIIRELAKRYMELATSEKQQKANRRMLDTNDLKVVRPPVLIDEIPWHELGCEELTLVCGDDFTRWIEWSLKSALYRKKYFGKADLLMPDTWTLHASFSSSPLGLESKHGMSERGSRIIYDVMEDEACLNEILPISFTTNPAADEATAARCEELFGDIIPVRLVGVDCQYFPIWDDISFLRGVEPIYEDLYDRPEYLHRIMKIFCDRVAARLDFIEANMKVNPDPYYLHSTPGRVTPVAQEGLKATWFRGTAQCFSSVSPAMFKEFELDYIKPLAERFGYTYYGCCEPLDDRIELLRSIKNLRKIGVSPWANPEKCAEQIRGDYVMSRKPNPAHVAHETDPAVIRREAEESVKAALKYGCPMDYVLKDITTVSNKPQNLILWAETVSDVMDAYYGAD